jgi:hypothetical protein
MANIYGTFLRLYERQTKLAKIPLIFGDFWKAEINRKFKFPDWRAKIMENIIILHYRNVNYGNVCCDEFLIRK